MLLLRFRGDPKGETIQDPCVSTGSSLRFMRSVYVSDGSNDSVGNNDITWQELLIFMYSIKLGQFWVLAVQAVHALDISTPATRSLGNRHQHRDETHMKYTDKH